MQSVESRIEQLDWDAIGNSLDEDGFATTPLVLTSTECAELIAMYADESRFRSRIEMARFRFGIGEYKYFAAPLPSLVQGLREALYSRLVPIASRWMASLRSSTRFPPQLSSFLQLCRRKGQTKPTPLMLCYDSGGYNCLHQDLYGEISFPLQFTFVLSKRGADYEGGEFLLVEQRPRAQSRGESITLDRGEAIVFANSHRPVRGGRGYYRANMRHGVSRLKSGRRYSLGIIFHDAK